MEIKKKIKILKKMEKVFRKPPNAKYDNVDGLCYYLYNNGYCTDDVADILGSKYSDSDYTIADCSQEDMLPSDSEIYARADWCRNEIDRLKGYLVSIFWYI